jgi:hypothetical protein
MLTSLWYEWFSIVCNDEIISFWGKIKMVGFSARAVGSALIFFLG